MSLRALSPPQLLAQAAAGDRGALARLLSVVERGGEASAEVARLTYAAPPPFTVGMTGAPGSGKSTLTNQLLQAALGGWPPADPDTDPDDPDPDNPDPDPDNPDPDDHDHNPAPDDPEPIDQIAVLAVDPSSPFSGGAILGDRIRMQDHATDPSVYIRSMATRGHLGGLALAVPGAVRVLGAAGLPVVVVETVGVGQMEVEIASAADTTVVVVTPGWGDAMQANKAGLLEIADLFVVNKADRPGVREARRDLEQMLDLSAPSAWRPPVLETVATTGEGVAQLWAAVARHRAHLRATGELGERRRKRFADELRRVLTARLLEEVKGIAGGAAFSAAVRAISEGRLDPYTAADGLLGPLLAPIPTEPARSDR